MSISLGDIIAILSLCISLYVTLKTWNFKKNEQELVEVQKKLGELQLQKELDIIDDSQKALIDARIVKLGNNKYRLKVYNKGKSPAFNVNIEFPDGDKIVYDFDLDRKLPLEKLESQHHVDLIADFYNGTKAKHKVSLKWEEKSGIRKTNMVYVTF